jgi:hypothetical protein
MVQWTFPEGDRDYLHLIQRLPLDVGSVPRRQHVVSRAILKGFAAPRTSGSGWSLRPFNVARNEVQRDRGLAWKAVEDRLPPAITAARNCGADRGGFPVVTSAVATSVATFSRAEHTPPARKTALTRPFMVGLARFEPATP